MAKTNTQIIRRQYAKISYNKIIDVSIQLATSDDVRTWSHGEVTKPETISYKTYRPERNGLFDEVIFGPQTGFRCPICLTKYKRSNEGQICEKTDECRIFQPEILSSATRRTRMGHIELAKPVVHFWFNKVDHSIIAKLLGLEYDIPVIYKDDGTRDKREEVEGQETKKISTKAAARREIDDIIYFRSHIVLENGGLKSLPKNFILNVNNATIVYCNAFYELLGIHKESKNKDAIDEIGMAIEELEDLATSSIGKDYGIDFYEYNDIIESYSEAKIGTGAIAIEYLLENVDVKAIATKVKREITSINRTLDEEFKKGKPVNSKIVRRDKLYKRLEVLNGFVASGQDPKSMLIYNLPVMPADLRPLIQIDGGRHSTTDVNELYRRIIIRNDRLKKWIELKAPILVMQNEMRMLQEAVDALIDNSRKKPSPVLSKDNRPLKSIADYLLGKKGRFRQNLLGKRVDYSGRSVIIVGPSLKMHQAGIPREMATKLFEPWIIKALIKAEIATSIKIAKKMIEELSPKIWPFVEKTIDKKVVLLNRAPTLHRLSIQAFEPILIRGKAIRLHPLVTTAFNADFDGDQMAIHVPVSKKAILEAKELMLANKNILNPKNGEIIIGLSQDIIIGINYLTREAANVEGEGRIFKDYSELEKVYQLGKINLHARVAMPVHKAKKKYLKTKEGYIISTVGKFLFNQCFPKSFAFIFDDTSDKGTFDKTYSKYIAKPGTNLHEFIKNLPLNKSLNKKNIAKIARKVFDDYVATISKGDLAKVINQVNSDNANDQVENVTQLINYKGEKLSNKHIEIIAEIIKSHFDKINKRVTKSNEGVERIFEIEEKVELFEKVWFDYTNVVAHTLDNIKDLGFNYSMISGTTMSISDIILSPNKALIIKDGEKYIQNLQNMYESGFLTDDERYRLVIKKWADVKTEVEQDLRELTIGPKNKDNPILNMIFSGARGNMLNLVQIAGLKGLMVNNKRNHKAFAAADIKIRSTIETPIKSSFLEGLTAFEFYTTIPGARKGLTDTALNTANAGFLTRRLVDVAQNIVVREEDCSSGKGFDIKDIVDTKNNTVIVTMEERIKGRFAATPIINPKTGEVIVEHNELITNSKAVEIVKAGIKKVEIRSVLGCQTKNGICKKCYGKDLATNRIVQIGEPVGVIAAQSIGEPGTQLTMRTFHTGGVAGVEDITGGFDRLKQLIDAIKTPWETPAVISKSVGKIYRIEPKSQKFGDIVVETPFDTEVVCKIHQGDKIIAKGTSLTIKRDGSKETIKYNVLGEKDKIIDYLNYSRIAHKNLIVENIEVTDTEIIFSGKQAEISQYVVGRRIRVKKNNIVKPGDKLVDGPIILTELLEYAGTTAVQNYLIKEIQRLYRMQGISIADKYIEIIVHQMFSKVLISIVGDSSFFAGSLVDINDYRIENAKLLAKGKNPTYGTIQISGANKIPLLSSSFLAAASYQETDKVLVHSSISGRIDNLEGLKENVIIGNQITAGTGTNYELKGKYHIVDPKQYFKK